MSEEKKSNAQIESMVIETMKTVYDPEIPVNIYELGLVYSVEVDDDGVVHIRMTLTSPNCPAAESLPGEIKSKVRDLGGVEGVDLQIVWEPPWSPELMSDAAKLELGMM